MNAITIGRPTVITDDTVRKLEVAFESGMNVQTACRISGISRSTYYKTYGDNTDFSDKMARSQDYWVEIARWQIGKAIEAGDMVTCRWYLERKQPLEFSLRHIVVESVESVSQRETSEAIFAAFREIADLLRSLK